MEYSYSTDEERYYGPYASAEEAAEEGLSENEDAQCVFVGENRTPVPEDCVHAQEIIKSVRCHEDFSNEWAEGWPWSTEEQRQELTEAIRKTFGEWIDKHGLRPTFFTVGNVKEFRRPE